MKDENVGAGTLLLSFFLGGVVGAGLALLLAPEKGEETRRKLKDAADGIREKTSDYIIEAKEKAAAVTDEGREYFDEARGMLKTALDAGKEAFEKGKERLSKEADA